jgi:hypothetical protein
MSNQARETLALRQADLLRALSGRGAVPEGFRAERVLEEAAVLVRKRASAVAKCRPALARALGRRFRERFSAFAETHATQASACADGAAFASWFDDQLGDERSWECVDWRVGARALLETVESTRDDPEAEPPALVRADLEQFQALLAAIVARRGPSALETPPLKAALVVASLEALGLELGRYQVETLRRELTRELAAAPGPSEPPANVLDAAVRALGTNLKVERLLSWILRSAERARYLERVGDDPFFGQAVPRHEISGTDTREASELLAEEWMELFELGEGARPAALRIARELVQGASSVPDPAVAPERRRETSLGRALLVLALQRKAEAELGRDPSLTRDEKARVVERRGSIVLVLSPSRDLAVAQAG